MATSVQLCHLGIRRVRPHVGGRCALAEYCREAYTGRATFRESSRGDPPTGDSERQRPRVGAAGDGRAADVNPGDPHGVTSAATEPPYSPPPPIDRPSAWSGWPAEWWTPELGPRSNQLADTAWTCIDKNASAPGDDAAVPGERGPDGGRGLAEEPGPGDLHELGGVREATVLGLPGCGEAFVLATACYSTGWPARFHVVPPWYVNVELDSRLPPVLDRRGRRDRRRAASALSVVGRMTRTATGRSRPADAFVAAAAVLARYGPGLRDLGRHPAVGVDAPGGAQSPSRRSSSAAEWVAARAVVARRARRPVGRCEVGSHPDEPERHGAAGAAAVQRIAGSR